jgi:hypothetical protein
MNLAGQVAWKVVPREESEGQTWNHENDYPEYSIQSTVELPIRWQPSDAQMIQTSRTPKKNQPDDHHTFKPSPLQFGWFLTHAEEDMGVKNASCHEYVLADEGYGDVLQLKQAVPLW